MLEMVNAEWGWGGSSPKLLPDINIVYNVGHHPSLRQGGGWGSRAEECGIQKFQKNSLPTWHGTSSTSYPEQEAQKGIMGNNIIIKPM